jgi:alpha-tubulin suppressor-like RCC1 family protein
VHPIDHFWLRAFALSAAAVATSVGCTKPTRTDTGAASVIVQALQISDVHSVSVTVAGASLSVPLVIPLVRSGNQFSGLAGNLPVGAAYTFTASAVNGATPPAELYHGAVTNQVIRKNATANIIIDMNQVAPAVGYSNQAPRLDAVSVSSFQASYGDTIALKAAAHDPDAGETALLTFTWAAACGSIGSKTVTAGTDATPSVSDAIFTAPNLDGNCVVTLTVTDPHGLGSVASFAIAVSGADATGNANVTVNLDTYPVIAAMTAEPAQIVPGASTNLSVIAADTDGDALTYAWSTACPGTFSSPASAITSFTLSASATNLSCDFQVVVTDGNFADGRPKGGVIKNHLILAVKPIEVTVPPQIDLTYQSRSGFEAGSVVDLGIAATDPSGGTLSYVWTSSFGPAPVSASLADIGLDPSHWSAGATWTTSALPSDGSSVVLTVTATSSATGLSSGSQFRLIPGPVIAALGADRTQFTPDAMTAQLSVSAVGAQGDVLLYDWSSSCPGTFSTANQAVSAFTLAASANVSSCDFAVTVTDVEFPDGPASGGQTGGHVIIGVRNCSQANACGGCAVLAGAPGSACGSCGSYLCSPDGSAVTCSDPGLNACGGCGTLSFSPGSACGACGTYVCNAGRTAVSCSDPGLNACGGCGTLSNPPGSSCGVRGQYDCSASKSSVFCVDCVLGFHDGGDGVCRSTGTCSAGYHSDGTGTCVASGCAAGYVMSAGECSPTFASLSVGAAHVCGIKTGNTISCWGLNSSGQAAVPAATVVAAVGAGQSFSCGVLGDGSVGCLGDNSYGQTSPPSGSFTTVSAGYYHACALRTNGNAACWGQNTYGQASAPAGTFTSISAGGYHTCGVKSDGTGTCWGLSTSQQTNVPAGNYLTISAGRAHTCAVKTGGNVVCWGSNSNGQAPTTAPAGTFTSISAGASSTCGVKSDGTLACWGDNAYGESTPPTGTFASVAVNTTSACAVKTDGSVVCWGDNTYGQVSLRTSAYRAVSAGATHTCQLKTDGSVACWGSNGNGESTPPTGTFAAVSVGVSHSCGLKSDSSVTCWGSNSSGQATAPSGSFASLSAGDNHNCGVKTDGSVVCWGLNTSGQATAPTGTSFASVSAGGSHTCAVRTDGSATCWGSNASGQAPTAPAGTFSSLAAGANHTCAVQSNGTIACCGLNTNGQATPPTGNFVSVSAGSSSNFTCGVKTSGAIACWGQNTYGQTSAPAGSFDVVSAAQNHSCALSAGGILRCWGYYWNAP